MQNWARWLVFTSIYFCSVAYGQDFDFSSNENNLLRLNDGRNLQGNTARGFFLNVISSISINLSNNIQSIEIIYDVIITEGKLTNFQFGIFDDEFGEIIQDSLSATVDGDVAVVSATSSNSREIAFVTFPKQIEEDFTAVLKFQVRGLICQHNDNEQAVTATWISMITSTETTQVEVDFILPIEEDGFSETSNPEITPDTQKVLLVEDDKLKVFAPYNPSDIGFGEARANLKNIFLHLEGNFLRNAKVKSCVVIETSNFYIFLIAGIVGIFCCCVVVGALYQKFAEDSMRSSTRRDRNRGAAVMLHYYPGSPDIVLAPSHGPEVTVRAMRESEDLGEIGEVPVNTIDVRNWDENEDQGESEAQAARPSRTRRTRRNRRARSAIHTETEATL